MSAITTATMAIIGGLPPPLPLCELLDGRFGVPEPWPVVFDAAVLAAVVDPGFVAEEPVLPAPAAFAFDVLDEPAPDVLAPAAAGLVLAWPEVDLSACLPADDFDAPLLALADVEALVALLFWSAPLFEGASLRFSSLMWRRIPPVADSP
ncbi:hypothetical protein [Salinisphaera sp.]|uniref:hypothetical protein n=1 Tax=Salinisphaera sp. TaxID=1914330 RepID=UPI0025DC3F64|nr:hypothetical protein [Salinisphaera sp.]